MTDRPLVVVLGASGFIGSSLTRALARRPIRLRAVARRPSPVPADAVAEIEVLEADLTADGVLADVVKDADVVLHLVAYTDAGWRVAEGDTSAERVNVGLVRDLVEAVRTHRPDRPPVVLFAGTKTQVGKTEHDRIDGTEPDRPLSPYGKQKLAAENLLKDATTEGLMRAVSLRLPTVYGGSAESTVDDKGVVSTMVRRALSSEQLTIWGDGSVRRDLVYIDDVTSAFTAALDHADELAGQHWLIGTCEGVPLGVLFAEIADIVAAHTGEPAVGVSCVEPPPNADPGDTQSVEMDASAFRAVTGWTPRAPRAEGLQRTVAVLALRG